MSFNKANLERHEAEMHDSTEYFSSELSVRQQPETIVGNLVTMKLVVVSNERKVLLLSQKGCIGSKLLPMESFNVSFDIKSMECTDNKIIMNGENQWLIKKVSKDGNQFSSSDFLMQTFSSKIVKCILKNDEAVFLLQNSIEVKNIKDGTKHSITFESDLVDVTMISGEDETLLVLDNVGSIWVSSWTALKSEEFIGMKKMKNFEDSSIVSIFYSFSMKTLFISDNNNKCFKIDIQDDVSIETNSMERKVVEVIVNKIILNFDQGSSAGVLKNCA